MSDSSEGIYVSRHQKQAKLHSQYLKQKIEKRALFFLDKLHFLNAFPNIQMATETMPNAVRKMFEKK